MDGGVVARWAANGYDRTPRAVRIAHDHEDRRSPALVAGPPGAVHDGRRWPGPGAVHRHLETARRRLDEHQPGLDRWGYPVGCSPADRLPLREEVVVPGAHRFATPIGPAAPRPRVTGGTTCSLRPRRSPRSPAALGAEPTSAPGTPSGGHVRSQDPHSTRRANSLGGGRTAPRGQGAACPRPRRPPRRDPDPMSRSRRVASSTGRATGF